MKHTRYLCFPQVICEMNPLINFILCGYILIDFVYCTLIQQQSWRVQKWDAAMEIRHKKTSISKEGSL